jgi:hypothetical protein
MTLLVPDEGEVRMLTELLDGGTSRENWTLKLYKNDKTPAEADTPAAYTECDFTDYVAKTLTRTVGAGTWGTPATADGTTSSTYNSGTPLSWTCGASGNTVYGYYVVGASSGKLIYAERFGSARTLVNGDVLNLTPKLELA